MKRTLTLIATAVGSLLVPSAPIRAQSMVAVYKIPFSFNAEGVELASGKYTVSQAGLQSGMLRSDHGEAILFITAPLSSKPGLAHLTFYKYANRYFLRQVSDDGGMGSKIPLSREEREIIRSQQQAKITPPQLTVVAER